MSAWTEFSNSVPDNLYFMNNGTAEYSLPAWLREYREEDQVVKVVILEAQQLGVSQLQMYEGLIKTLIDRDKYLISELMQYKNKYGEIPNGES